MRLTRVLYSSSQSPLLSPQSQGASSANLFFKLFNFNELYFLIIGLYLFRISRYLSCLDFFKLLFGATRYDWKSFDLFFLIVLFINCSQELESIILVWINFTLQPATRSPFCCSFLLLSYLNFTGWYMGLWMFFALSLCFPNWRSLRFWFFTSF